MYLSLGRILDMSADALRGLHFLRQCNVLAFALHFDRGHQANTIMQIVMPEVVVVEKLEESVRGAGGFGSTGGFGA